MARDRPRSRDYLIRLGPAKRRTRTGSPQEQDNDIPSPVFIIAKRVERKLAGASIPMLVDLHSTSSQIGSDCMMAGRAS